MLTLTCMLDVKGIHAPVLPVQELYVYRYYAIPAYQQAFGGHWRGDDYKYSNVVSVSGGTVGDGI
jgi:hypothetical protein